MKYTSGKNPNSRNGFKPGYKGGLGEKNVNWKGDDASVSAIHIWIKGKRGNPKYCEHCKRSDKKKYEWANKDHAYKRKIEDYMRLCTSCHRKYDIENNNFPNNYNK